MDDRILFQKQWYLKSPDLPSPNDGLRGLAGASARARLFPQSPNDIIGRYRAYIILTYIDVAVAHAALPAYLQLAPPPGTPPGKHPAMYSFGTHEHVHPRFFTLWDYSYDEALVGLPNVLLRQANGSTTGPFFHMTAVRLDNLFADEIGVAMGFPKKMAKFQVTNNSYSFRMGGGPIMTGQFQLSGGVFDSSFPNFQVIEKFMLQQPVITQSPLGNLLQVPFHIFTDTAVMQPATAAIEIADMSLPGLPAGKYNFQGIDVAPIPSCYHSIHDWQMSPPQSIHQ